MNILKNSLLALFTVVILLVCCKSSLYAGDVEVVYGKVVNMNRNTLTIDVGTNNDSIKKAFIREGVIFKGDSRIGIVRIFRIFADSLWAGLVPDSGFEFIPITETIGCRVEFYIDNNLYITNVEYFEDGRGLVTISAGSNAGIRLGGIYKIPYRPKKQIKGRLTNNSYGDLVKGKIFVIDVQYDSSKAIVIFKTSDDEIKVGDVVEK